MSLVRVQGVSRTLAVAGKKLLIHTVTSYYNVPPIPTDRGGMGYSTPSYIESLHE